MNGNLKIRKMNGAFERKSLQGVLKDSPVRV